MEDVVNLHNWAAWKFGQFEYRLCGYTQDGNQLACLITEPILGVSAEQAFVETIDHKKYKLDNPINKVDMIDMAYVLDRWCNINNRGTARNATDMVIEALNVKPTEEST